MTKQRLKEFSESFLKLSKTFSNLSEKKTILDQNDVSQLIDDVVANVCVNCDLRSLCWENNFYNTYQTVFSMLASCEQKGKIDASDIPDSFATSCLNINNFSHNVNRFFELYKTNLTWKNKIIESRELVSQQLIGVSSLIESLSDELSDEISFKDKKSEILTSKLIESKIAVKNLIVTENKYGKTEVVIKHSPCYGDKDCTKHIIPVISSVLNKKMGRDCSECINCYENKDHICILKLVEENKFRISTSVATAIKDGSKKSGDCYSFMPLKDGKYLLALSDGMGSGDQAMRESAATIELFEDFMTAGFDKDMAINIINSVLVLKSAEESFSTLDVCTIDLHSGYAEFIKIGAVSTFIKRGDNVISVKSDSLPVGILSRIEADSVTKKLEHEDFIIMVTDGIIDSRNTIINKENWLMELLQDTELNNPMKIASHIIEKAKENTKGKVKDDMTVLVSKVWNK